MSEAAEVWQERQHQMMLALVDELGLDQQRLETLPLAEALREVQRAHQERGIRQEDLDGWMAVCGREEDYRACFREKVRRALEEPISVPRVVVLSALTGLSVAFAATWWRGR